MDNDMLTMLGVTSVIPLGIACFVGYTVFVFPYIDDPDTTYYTGVLVDVEIGEYSIPTMYFDDGKVIRLSFPVNDLVIGQKYVVTHQYNKWTNINESD